ncbi:uncharacterized protein N7483_002945 [Penicillium malachiteum]|uniref:uncharacterized protein n=1 Tax=Penicillium malachiteum TaxID=1324776 RepID=UPI002546C22E|nr:uncharacterized protein N7483_002945 [Penicillium malachiteum]KAJ5737820.1 hypothetical protein N7483_002945 [Penicillium malachiteum]
MDLLTQRFSHTRAHIVHHLEGYSDNIMEKKTRYYREIARALEEDAEIIDSLTRTMISDSGHTLRLPLCARERISRIKNRLESLREILILEKDKPQHEIIAIFDMISRHVGRIKPVGSHIADPSADAMDREIRELQRLYGTKGSSASTNQDLWLEYWEALDFSDSWCGCSYCKTR